MCASSTRLTSTRSQSMKNGMSKRHISSLNVSEKEEWRRKYFDALHIHPKEKNMTQLGSQSVKPSSLFKKPFVEKKMLESMRLRCHTDPAIQQYIPSRPIAIPQQVKSHMPGPKEEEIETEDNENLKAKCMDSELNIATPKPERKVKRKEVNECPELCIEDQKLLSIEPELLDENLPFPMDSLSSSSYSSSIRLFDLSPSPGRLSRQSILTNQQPSLSSSSSASSLSSFHINDLSTIDYKPYKYDRDPIEKGKQYDSSSFIPPHMMTQMYDGFSLGMHNQLRKKRIIKI